MRNRSRLIALLTTTFLLSALLLVLGGGVARADNWEKVAGAGILGDYNQIQEEVNAAEVFGGNLYITTYSGWTGAQVWR